MPIFQFIAELSTRKKFRGLEQDQNEALIDALAAAKAIDGKLLDVERRELMEAMKMLDWEGGRPLEDYVDAAVERATEIAPEPAELDAFFGDIGERLGEDWLREEAYYLSSRIALADEEVDESERVFLKHMVEAFEIPSDKQELIVRKIRNEM